MTKLFPMLRSAYRRVFSIVPSLEYKAEILGAKALVRLGIREFEFPCYGHTFLIDPSDWVQSWIFWERYEPENLDFVRSQMKDGCVFFDVGANVGLFSIVAAGRGARVIAFEPSERVSEKFRRNVRRNKMDTLVSLVEAAVSDHVGNAILFADPRGSAGERNEGLASLSQANAMGGMSGHAAGCTVVTTTIDEIVTSYGLTRLDLIKMDIQGAEYAALLGARTTLRDLRPAVLMEWDLEGAKAFGWDAGKVDALLLEVGYTRRHLEAFSVLLEPDA